VHNHTDPGTWPAILNTVANLGIVAGYLIVPFTVLRRLPLTRFVRISGVVFFVTCATTHAAMAFGVERTAGLVANHVVQAGAVWCFVVGFARLVQQAERARRARRGGDPSGTSR